MLLWSDIIKTYTLKPDKSRFKSQRVLANNFFPAMLKLLSFLTMLVIRAPSQGWISVTETMCSTWHMVKLPIKSFLSSYPHQKKSYHSNMIR